MFSLAAGIFHPEYHDKLEYKQEISISIDDLDNDLEMIKEPLEIESNFDDFHKEVQNFRKTEREKGWDIIKAIETIPKDFVYPDSPYQIAGNRKRLSLLQRQKKWKDSVYGSRKNSHNDMAKRNSPDTPENGPNENNTETGLSLKKEYDEKMEDDLKNGKAYNYTDEGKAIRTGESPSHLAPASSFFSGLSV